MSEFYPFVKNLKNSDLTEEEIVQEFIKETDPVKQIVESCIQYNWGGPFGALVIKDGELVGMGCNQVLKNNDPTAHAEIVAIREACKNLGTHDLTGCILYATGYPCPMCMSAIMWANIKTVYYTMNYKEAEDIGFRDDFIHKFIKNGCKDKDTLNLKYIEVPGMPELYNLYDSRKSKEQEY